MLILVAAIGGVATSGADVANVNGLAPSDAFFGSAIVHAGWGLYLDVVASASLGVAAIVLLHQPHPEGAKPETPSASDAGA